MKSLKCNAFQKEGIVEFDWKQRDEGKIRDIPESGEIWQKKWYWSLGDGSTVEIGNADLQERSQGIRVVF